MLTVLSRKIFSIPLTIGWMGGDTSLAMPPGILLPWWIDTCKFCSSPWGSRQMASLRGKGFVLFWFYRSLPPSLRHGDKNKREMLPHQTSQTM
ncbi:hypothetical protein CEXT_262771 [Caerostris extrusa]|uniref:Uncharacterized protein n=1 Tax=Caerostris extrusa TaxID=172846 RepID=A0AAV4WBZ2_CAEEX|nr:hypothetical protein CEXT_262771 [Caerostris extrusa]